MAWRATTGMDTRVSPEWTCTPFNVPEWAFKPGPRRALLRHAVPFGVTQGGAHMRIRRFAPSLVLIPAVVIAAACGRGNAPVADDALKNDLSLAAQAHPGQQVASPLEAGYAPQQARQVQAVARRPVSAPVRRTASTVRSAGTIYSAPEPVYRTEKHTTRDAAIG